MTGKPLKIEIVIIMESFSSKCEAFHFNTLEDKDGRLLK